MKKITELPTPSNPFVLTLMESFSAMQDYYTKAPSYKRDRTFGIFFAVLGIISLTTKGICFPSIAFLLVALFLLSKMSPLSIYLTLQDYRNNPNLLENRIIITNNDCLCIRSKSIENTVAWSKFQTLIESRNFFFLILGKGHYLTIPKRVFSSEEDRVIFYNFVSSKLRENSKDSGGVPPSVD